VDVDGGGVLNFPDTYFDWILDIYMDHLWIFTGLVLWKTQPGVEIKVVVDLPGRLDGLYISWCLLWFACVSTAFIGFQPLAS
jgi:hypothetical protein